MTHRMDSDIASETVWFKSSYSQENATACVEIADLTASGRVAIRDSKDKAGPAILIPADSFAAFITAVRDGDFGA